MAKYLVKARYTTEGVKGIAKGGGSARRDAVEETVRSVGGSVEGFYFAFGADDAFVIADLPDNQAAAAIALTVGASGAASVETVTLLTPEEVDAAAEQSVEYRPPGK
jgi:uncharacterized protein with GYD domain